MTKNLTDKEIGENKQLTLKQRKWLKAYIETGNKTQAAKLAGYEAESDEGFAVIGSENYRKLNVPELLEEMGLTHVALINYGAEKMKSAKKIHGTGDNFVEIPDEAIQYKYWENFTKMKKMVNTNTDEGSKDKIIVIPILGGKTKEAVIEGEVVE